MPRTGCKERMRKSPVIREKMLARDKRHKGYRSAGPMISQRQPRLSPSPALPRISPRRPHRCPCSAAVERRDDILSEPPELLLELLGGQSLGPVDHKSSRPGYFASIDLIPSMI